VPLIAKYPTSCAICSSGVSPGEEISKVAGRWAHVACASDDPPAGPAAGQQALPQPGGARSGTATRSGQSRVQRARPEAMPAAAGALEVWTDGACSGNPGPGGWAWATEDGRQGSGGAAATTNQRMEVQAALEAVQALDGPLVVVSDSTYVVNCFRDAWWKGWLARGWVNSAKKPVANRDLWEPLIVVVRDRGDISFRWVKGHSGDPMNDLVDRLAVAAGKAGTP
jgi:ribonuclease HI